MSKIALIAGGAGNVGSAVATAFLESGDFKTVVITSRSQEKIDSAVKAIRAKVGAAADKIVGVVGNVSDEAGSEALKKKVVEAVGDKINCVISSVGFAFRNFGGPTSGVTFQQMQGVFDDQFFGTFGAYKQFMPLVKNVSSGSYVFVTGGGSDMFLGPGTGGMSIGGAASQALARVVMKENAADPSVTCTEVSFVAGICPDPSVMPPGFTWLQSGVVGKALASVATKRKADVRTIAVKSADDLQQLISNGVLGEANGAS